MPSPRRERARRAREHTRHGRDRAWPRGDRTRADQQENADRDEELPHPLRSLPDTALCISLAMK
jgi:hypothetical protein